MPFVRVALDVPIPHLFDYKDDLATDQTIGCRVVVPFGRKRLVGVVVEIDDTTELSEQRIRSVEAVLHDLPPLPKAWIDFCRFAADYYQRPLGEVIHAALPPRLRKPAPLDPPPALLALTSEGRTLLDAIPARDRAKRRVLESLLAGPLPEDVLAVQAEVPRASVVRMIASGSIESVAAETVTPSFIAAHPLNDEQATAADTIAGTAGFGVYLLLGITGSGKTEVYFHAIARALAKGQQALVLVPEIGLTPVLEAAFRNRFPGANLAVQHSGLAEGERARAFRSSHEGTAHILLGTRLAVLTPMPRLGIVVVDEEQDSSFKQQDGFRYSARDLAVVRAQRACVPVVLSSATPSLETYRHALDGRYRMLRLGRRAHGSATLPTVKMIDTRESPAKDGLSPLLEKAIAERLARGEQSLVFLNRRGYAPSLLCNSCGWVGDCNRCSSHLVVHLKEKTLRCHHCGYSIAIPRACPHCGNVDLAPVGRGTQRLEAALAERFPNANIVRVDSDSTGGRPADILVRAAQADILVGTQILAKGHHFALVTLVGVVNADAGLFAADYRAAERLFAQLAQVAGRSGRADLAGEVMVQTRFPQHPLYQALLSHDYENFAHSLLAEREQAGFPPYLFEAALRADAPEMAESIAFLKQAASVAPDAPGMTVFEPVPQTLERLSGRDRAQLVVQSASRQNLQRFLRKWRTTLEAQRLNARVRWHFDVDPIEF